MQPTLLFLLTYLAVINLIAFALYGSDKRSAIRGEGRVRETTLLGVAAIGGSLGAFAAQRLFRHKVSKRPFQLKFGAILALQAAGLVALALWTRR